MCGKFVRTFFYDAYVNYLRAIDFAYDVKTFYTYIKAYIDIFPDEKNVPCAGPFADEIKEQFWCILVDLFGDYGVSLRTGWIKDVEGALNFLDELYKDLAAYEESTNE